MEIPLNVTTKPPTHAHIPETERPVHSVPADDLIAAGKRLREMVPRASHGVWKRPKDRTHADPLRTHAAIAVHVLPRFCQCHGVRSVDGAGYRRPRPGLRRLPSAQLRRIRHARTEHRLRHQRLRRDLAGALGMGRQTAGCLVRPGRAGQWPVGVGGPRRGSRGGTQLSRAVARGRGNEPARRLVRQDRDRGFFRPGR